MMVCFNLSISNCVKEYQESTPTTPSVCRCVMLSVFMFCFLPVFGKIKTYIFPDFSLTALEFPDFSRFSR